MQYEAGPSTTYAQNRMKKLSRERLDSITNASEVRWRNAISRKGKKYIPHQKSNKLLGQELITAPEVISIYDFEGEDSAYQKTLEFLDLIKDRYRLENCILDFSETKKITAAALVVVYAELESACSGRNGKASIRWSSAPKVNSILRTSNLPRLISGYDIKYSLSNAKSMPIVSSIGKSQMDEIIDFIQSDIYKDKMSPDTEYVYGDAVSETINNVGLHAYPGIEPDEKRWWLTCETFGKKLYLAIYDRGVGIPKTIVRHHWFLPSLKVTHPDEYKKLIADNPELETTGLSSLFNTRLPDENLILLSMQGDVTGTKQDKHGQGSKSIMALVSETDDGMLWVFSNHGLLTFSKEDNHPKLAKLDKKFPGTLVQWNIEIP